jgi:hypothetical protein
LRQCKASGCGFVCICVAGARDEGVAGTVGVEESIELPDLGVEGGKLTSRVRKRRCDVVC